jgi:hypothetical protein
MKQVIFTDLNVVLNGGRGTVTATIPNGNQFSHQELRHMLASILQSITNIGDGYGQPDINAVSITGNTITGSLPG